MKIYDNKTINKIKLTLENTQFTDIEKEAYEHTKKVIDWIELKNKKYINCDYHYLFLTCFNI